MCQGERVDPNDDLTCYRSRVVNELIREKNRLYLFSKQFRLKSKFGLGNKMYQIQT